MTQNPAAPNGDERLEQSKWGAPNDDLLSDFGTDQNIDGDRTHARVAALLDDVTVQDLEPQSPAASNNADEMLPPIALTRETAPEVTNAVPVEPAAAESDAGVPPEREPASLGSIADGARGEELRGDAPEIDDLMAAATAGAAEAAAAMSVAEEAELSSHINIKGRSGGVAVEIGYGEWEDVIADLDTRLKASGGFFRGGHVALDMASRDVVAAELDQLRSILLQHEMVLALVRTESDGTFQAALDLGLSAVIDSAGVEMASAQAAESNDQLQGQFVYRGNLRSGQQLRKDADVIIIGDVNPGAEIVSQGNILVWGRLRGIAHAGADGARDKVVGALLMEPIQVRIADLVAVVNTNGGKRLGRRNKKRDEVPGAMIASIDGERIVTAAWDRSRGGFQSTRRR